MLATETTEIAALLRRALEQRYGDDGIQHFADTSDTLCYATNENQDATRALIDEGADIVFGHGPHVTRAVEVYNSRFIAYSLGNFCTYAGINVSGVNGLAPIIKVYTNSKGEFIQAHITSTMQSHSSPVKIDSQNQVLKRIQELSREDFPDNPVQIDRMGWVRISTQ